MEAWRFGDIIIKGEGKARLFLPGFLEKEIEI
jgi:hypothetical protein